MPTLPNDEFTLEEVLATKIKSFSYEYYLGDGWRHQVAHRYRQRLPKPARIKYR